MSAAKKRKKPEEVTPLVPPPPLPGQVDCDPRALALALRLAAVGADKESTLKPCTVIRAETRETAVSFSACDLGLYACATVHAGVSARDPSSFLLPLAAVDVADAISKKAPAILLPCPRDGEADRRQGAIVLSGKSRTSVRTALRLEDYMRLPAVPEEWVGVDAAQLAAAVAYADEATGRDPSRSQFSAIATVETTRARASTKRVAATDGSRIAQAPLDLPAGMLVPAAGLARALRAYGEPLPGARIQHGAADGWWFLRWPASDAVLATFGVRLMDQRDWPAGAVREQLADETARPSLRVDRAALVAAICRLKVLGGGKMAVRFVADQTTADLVLDGRDPSVGEGVERIDCGLIHDDDRYFDLEARLRLGYALDAVAKLACERVAIFLPRKGSMQPVRFWAADADRDVPASIVAQVRV